MGKLSAVNRLILLAVAFAVAICPSLVYGFTLPSNLQGGNWTAITLTFTGSGPYMVTMNSLTYSTYFTPTLNNAEFFYSNGTIIKSWLEALNLSNEIQTTGYASNAIYWVNISPSVTSPATIYFGWNATASLLNNANTGEAPFLSASYGQYDTGNYVFQWYCPLGNLSSLPCGFAQSSLNPTISFQPDYLSITSSVSGPSGAISMATPSTVSSVPSVIDFYGYFNNPDSGAGDCFGLASTMTGNDGSFQDEMCADGSRSHYYSKDAPAYNYPSYVYGLQTSDSVFSFHIMTLTGSTGLQVNYGIDRPVSTVANGGTSYMQWSSFSGQFMANIF